VTGNFLAFANVANIRLEQFITLERLLFGNKQVKPMELPKELQNTDIWFPP
jgi:hypothetical protein